MDKNDDTERTRSERPDVSPEDRRLWQIWRSGRQPRPATGEIEAGLIAAYLDGGLHSSEREAVESWLAATPEAFDTLVSAREAMADGVPPTVSREIVSRARRLVGADGRPRPQTAPGGARGDPIRVWWGVLEWSVAACLLVVASVAGFEFGLQSAAPVAPTVEIAVGAPADSLEMWAPNDGLFEPFGTDGLDPDALSNGDAS